MAVAGDTCVCVWIRRVVGVSVCGFMSVCLNVCGAVCPANAICSSADAVGGLHFYGCGRWYWCVGVGGWVGIYVWGCVCV